jgi:two-component system NarL family sensor kinase
VILITSLVAISLGAAFVIQRTTQPSDGARLNPGTIAILPQGVVVTPLRDEPGGLQAGDIVLAVNGSSLNSWAQTLFGRSEPDRWQYGQTVHYTLLRNGQNLDIPIILGSYPFRENLRANWGLIVFALVYILVSGFVFLRQPDSAAGRVLFLSGAALVGSTAWSFGLQVYDFINGTGFWLYKITTLLIYDLFWIAGFHFALIFPRPLPVVRRSKWLIPAIYTLPYLTLAAFLGFTRMVASGPLDWFSRWTVSEGVHAAIFLSLTLIALFFQYRRNRTGITGQQIRWVVLAGLVAGGGGLLFYILPPLLGFKSLDPNGMALIVLPYPLAIAIAILRHNLFDIDTLINRALVYSALTAITMALYILIVGFFAERFQATSRTMVAFLTTGLVAVLFQPLRDRLQRWVNRLMYGERDDPVALLSRLGNQLERTGSPEDALAGITETVARALKLPYVAIELGQEGVVAASFGLESGQGLRLPLYYQSEITGFLVAAPRSPGESFDPKDRHLLETISHQAGAAAHAAKLTADLRLSRQKLVTAREEERRRLRRDLHDGLGPTLASLTLKLDAARSLLRTDPEKAEKYLNDLKQQTQATIKDVRTLVYELRPPALDELGVIGAIHHFIDNQTSSEPQITFQASSRIPPLPAALEVAVYRIALEGITNVLKHAGASSAILNIRMESDQLLIEIIDDGKGLSGDLTTGVGMTSMRERAEELGGTFEMIRRSQGALIRACLPLPKE